MTSEQLKALADEFANGMIANIAGNDANSDRLDEEAFKKSLEVEPLHIERKQNETETKIPKVNPSPFRK